MRHPKTAETIVFSILFLFFLQSLSDFIEAIYALGLLVTAFTIEVTSIILLFTPLLFLFIRKPLSRSFLLGIASLAIWLDWWNRCWVLAASWLPVASV